MCNYSLLWSVLFSLAHYCSWDLKHLDLKTGKHYPLFINWEIKRINQNKFFTKHYPNICSNNRNKSCCSNDSKCLARKPVYFSFILAYDIFLHIKKDILNVIHSWSVFSSYKMSFNRQVKSQTTSSTLYLLTTTSKRHVIYLPHCCPLHCQALAGASESFQQRHLHTSLVNLPEAIPLSVIKGC